MIKSSNTLSTSTNKDVVGATCNETFEIENNFVIEQTINEIVALPPDPVQEW